MDYGVIPSLLICFYVRAEVVTISSAAASECYFRVPLMPRASFARGASVLVLLTCLLVEVNTLFVHRTCTSTIMYCTKYSNIIIQILFSFTWTDPIAIAVGPLMLIVNIINSC